MKQIIDRIEKVLGESKKSHKKFQEHEQESSAELIYAGWVEAIECVLEIIKEERSKHIYPNQLTRKEFEEKLREFIRNDLGCDLRDGDELLRYDGPEWNHTWVLNIEKDDLHWSSSEGEWHPGHEPQMGSYDH